MRDARRSFLRVAGLFAGGAMASRYLPDAVLEAQANSPDAMRNQLGATPNQATKLSEQITLLSGPGGNVVVLHGPKGKVVVDGFVKPAWPKLKETLDAIDSTPIKSLIDTHWHFDHADNNANFREAGAGILGAEKNPRRPGGDHNLARS